MSVLKSAPSNLVIVADEIAKVGYLKSMNPQCSLDGPWRRLIPSIKMFRKFFRPQPLCTLKMCHTLLFYPAAYFHKVWVCSYLQIDAVSRNVSQILSAPFQRRCTLKMCQIPYSLAYLPLPTKLYSQRKNAKFEALK